MKFYKILNKEMCHHGFQYKEGLNVDTNEFNSKPTCGNGLFFSNANNILSFTDYGDLIADVEIPEGETYMSVMGTKYKAHSIIIKNIRPLYSMEVFQEIQKEATDQLFYSTSTVTGILRSKNQDLINMLLKKIIEQPKGISQYTALSYIIENDEFKLFKKLMLSTKEQEFILKHAIALTIRFDKIDMLKWIIKEFNDTRRRSCEIISLCNAIEYRNEKAISILLKDTKIIPDIVESSIYNGNMKLFKKIFKKWEEDSHLISDGGCHSIYYSYLNSYLRKAILYKNLEIMKFLLKKGADVSTTYPEILLFSPNEIMEYLLNNGLDVHYENDAFLMSAVEQNDIEKAKLLLKYGADPTARRGWIKRKASEEMLVILLTKTV